MPRQLSNLMNPFRADQVSLIAATFSGVTATFVRAVAAFDARDMGQLQNLLTEDVVLYKVNNQAPIIGRDDVMAYIRGVAADSPIFVPITTVLHPPTLPTSVRGEALWGDNDAGGPTILPIQYEFHFQNKTPFHITSLWATPDDPTILESRFRRPNRLR